MTNADYKYLYEPTHPMSHANGIVYEHRVIAEKVLGRKLKPEEVVHHIDEDKDNNSEENLIVFRTLSDHTRFHHTGKLKLMNDGTYISPSIFYFYKCKNCSNKVLTKFKGRKYCSKKCSEQGQRVAERPSSESLGELIRTKTFVELGKMFGVSDNAVRKWCKDYGLPYRKRDIK